MKRKANWFEGICVVAGLVCLLTEGQGDYVMIPQFVGVLFLSLAAKFGFRRNQ